MTEVLAARITTLLRSLRCDLSDEKRTQEDIAFALTANGMAFTREASLSSHERVDFLIGGLALEIKLRSAKMGVYRQLQRYAKHEAVKAVMLASNMAMGLPAEIEGKPAYFVSLGAAWI